MKHLHLTLVGFGVVRHGFAELLSAKHNQLRQSYDLDITYLDVATTKHGFMYRESDPSMPTLLELTTSRRPQCEHSGITLNAHTPNL